jgi:hypothetical protein
VSAAPGRAAAAGFEETLPRFVNCTCARMNNSRPFVRRASFPKAAAAGATSLKTPEGAFDFLFCLLVFFLFWNWGATTHSQGPRQTRAGPPLGLQGHFLMFVGFWGVFWMFVCVVAVVLYCLLVMAHAA